jgi:hypothetical protein
MSPLFQTPSNLIINEEAIDSLEKKEKEFARFKAKEKEV